MTQEKDPVCGMPVDAASAAAFLALVASAKPSKGTGVSREDVASTLARISQHPPPAGAGRRVIRARAFEYAADRKLVVRFVNTAPSEEVVFLARRCARQRSVAEGLTVVVRQAFDRGPQSYAIRLERYAREAVCEQDSDVLLALRNAFHRLRGPSEAPP